MTLVGPFVTTLDAARFLTVSQFLSTSLLALGFTTLATRFTCLRLESHIFPSPNFLLDSVDVQFLSMVASRSGPTPTLMIGNPIKLSIFST